MKKKVKRYQECSKIEQLWRRRWYLIVPFWAVWNTLFKARVYMDEEVDGKIVHTDKYEHMNFKNWMRILKGSVQSKMHYYYTQEEFEQHIDTWIENRKTSKD
jgi:hypothetical protein